MERMFTQPMSKDEVRAKIAGGTYSLADALIARAFAGDEKLLTEIFRRICDRQRPNGALHPDDAEAIITHAQWNEP